jgi:hypothetical protein
LEHFAAEPKPDWPSPGCRIIGIMGRYFLLLTAFLLSLGFNPGWCSERGSLPVPDPRRIPDFRRAAEHRDLREVPEEASRRNRRTSPASIVGDERWSDGFGLPVTDGDIRTAIEFQGSLVVAGRFTRIGDVAANNIALWDGTTWHPLGQGIRWGTVSTLAIHQGDLLVGGDYWFAGGIVCRSIARWNGTDWSPFGRGLEDALTNPREVRAIGSDASTLVVAVDVFIENYYGEPTPSPYPFLIFSWSGTDWVPLSPGANGPVWTFAFHDGAMFAGGAFDSIGNVPAKGVARWDGSTWSEVGGGIGSYGRSVDGMVSYSGQLIVGGSFDSAGGNSASNVAAWNGSQWEALGTLPTAVAAFIDNDGVLTAACENAVTQWDGQSWSQATPTLVGRPAGIAAIGGEVYVAGGVEATNPGETSPTALAVAVLANGSWHSLVSATGRMAGLTGPGGQSAYVSSMARRGDGIVVAGSFRYAGAPSGWAVVPGLAEWTGNEWIAFPAPPGLDFVGYLEARGDTLYAAGTMDHQEGTPSSVFRYDGSTWAPLGADKFFVNAMALYGGVVHVVAYDWRNNMVDIRRWTGSAWEAIGRVDGPYFPTSFGLVEWNGKLVTAGRFASVGGVAAANIAAWDGAAWEPIGPGLPLAGQNSIGIVRHLAVWSGRLLAAGDGLPGVVRWADPSWQPLGELLGTVYSLVTVDNDLFVSGNLRSEDFTHEYSLARWGGYRWDELGSGTNGSVLAAASLGGWIYLGGGFSTAGGRSAYAIARWAGFPAAPAVATIQSARPNPFLTSTTFFYSLPQPGNVRLSVHDARGREVAVIDEGTRSAGPHTAVWNGRDRSGRKLASGVYFIRAGFPGGVRKSNKVILLR